MAVFYKLSLAPDGAADVTPIPPFTADTLAHAQTTAQQWATLFQRACYLAPLLGSPPLTLYTAAAAGSALGAQATGIGF